MSCLLHEQQCITQCQRKVSWGQYIYTASTMAQEGLEISSRHPPGIDYTAFFDLGTAYRTETLPKVKPLTSTKEMPSPLTYIRC